MILQRLNLYLILSKRIQNLETTFERNSHKESGVVASKFPISIWTRIQGQHGCQIFRKIVYNYVTISDFANRWENLKNSKIFAKKFFFVKKHKL